MSEEETVKLRTEPLDGTIGESVYDELMSENYLLFAVSTLLGRALPYIDGLKPVQRRILHSMHQQGLYHDKGTVKCARIVGEVMGNYHPHGDSSIYEALVRMAQPFAMRVPLIDGQGNFGSLDGDGAAAMRYTEARLTQAAGEIIGDSHPKILDKHMGKNYTEDLPEPNLLPARFPNLLINGNTGIATGMTSMFLPHNPQEAIDLCIWRLKNPDAGDKTLVRRLSGPDFPTGASVVMDEGLQSAYLTGKGRVTGVSKAHIEQMPGNREKVVITEIPWMVNKGQLLRDLVNAYEKGDHPELVDLIDVSSDDVRIEAHLKRGVNSKAYLAKLLSSTNLKKTYAVEMNVVIGGVPKTVTLPELTDEFLSFRRFVVIKRAEKRIEEIEARLYKLDAYLKAISAIDAVVETIKKSKDRQDAKPKLMKLLKIDEQQAQWIVEMQLGSLTRLDSHKLEDEVKELQKELKHLRKFIKTESMVTDEMIEEFGEIKADWKKQGLLERRTTVIEAGEVQGDIPTMTSAQAEAEDGFLVVSTFGKAFCSTGTVKRGAAINLGKGDTVAVFQPVNTGEERLIFTDTGKVYRMRLSDLPVESRKSSGVDLRTIVGMDKDEMVVGALPVREEGSILFTTVEGTVKRTLMSDFANAHAAGVVAIKVDGDMLLDVRFCDDDQEIILVATNGKALRFPASGARNMGRNAAGVRGMKIGAEDAVFAVGVVSGDGGDLVVSTSAGYAKRISLDQIPTKGRGSQGVEIQKTGTKYGDPALAATVMAGSDILISENGKFTQLPANEVQATKRATTPKSWPGGTPERLTQIVAD